MTAKKHEYVVLLGLIDEHPYGLQFRSGYLGEGRPLTDREMRILCEALRDEIAPKTEIPLSADETHALHWAITALKSLGWRYPIPLVESIIAKATGEEQ
ncbi:hypothetical protein RSP822_18015 [Ralstonia solanacearum]|uniref:hypothetical protein n=1 Tax=Ralstonia solanacearum TaxID=305 RepID=UPI000E670CA3|nr:hypothetical protein [Ralstonia solanacearum]RIJ84968.1 hypothetical protein RSP822_18015 [Ralstonia solanacearum]